MVQKLNSLAIGYSVAIISAVSMLLLGIGGNVGIYAEAAEIMMQTHLFFDFSLVGIITGIIEAGIWGFVTGYLFAWVYNKFA